MDLSSKGIHLIQGSKGSSVQITLQRDPPKQEKENHPQEPLTFDVTLTRDDIVMQERRFKTTQIPFGEGNIGVIELYSFYTDEKGGCAQDIKNQILEMKQKGNLSAIVLDLRHNLGGLLVEAVELSGLFLHPGVVVSAKDASGQIQTLRHLTKDPVWEGPLFVLISKSSASSSEIVAAALQDWGRALILGDPHSFGKGSFFVFPLNTKKWDPTGVFSITQGLYYTASGKSPQFNGVQSDIAVPGPMATLDIGEKTLKYPLPTSQIEPRFKDDLSDVGFFDKRYLEKAYLPFVQEPSKIDPALVEKLRENSQLRQASAPFGQTSKEDQENEQEEAPEPDLRAIQSEWQLQECLNIVKDWLYLEHALTQKAA
jgi:carboxyl-terminal processing protease